MHVCVFYYVCMCVVCICVRVCLRVFASVVFVFVGVLAWLNDCVCLFFVVLCVFVRAFFGCVISLCVCSCVCVVVV